MGLASNAATTTGITKHVLTGAAAAGIAVVVLAAHSRWNPAAGVRSEIVVDLIAAV